MALIYEGMACPVCGEVVDIDGPYFVTGALAGPEGAHPLPLSDAAIHWRCVWGTAEAEHLIDASFEAFAELYARSNYWRVLLGTEGYRVATNELVVRVEIRAGHVCLDLSPAGWAAQLRARLGQGDILEHLPTERAEQTRAAVEAILREAAALG